MRKRRKTFDKNGMRYRIIAIKSTESEAQGIKKTYDRMKEEHNPVTIYRISSDNWAVGIRIKDK